MQIISENVPVEAPQKFNKLTSFDSMKITMKENNRARFHSKSGIPI